MLLWIDGFVKILVNFDLMHAHKAPCAVLWNSINVTCEGYLALCCSEVDNRLVIEDLHEKPLLEAWQGKRMSMIRDLHRRGDIADLPCYPCVFDDDDADYPPYAMLMDDYPLWR